MRWSAFKKNKGFELNLESVEEAKTKGVFKDSVCFLWKKTVAQNVFLFVL